MITSRETILLRPSRGLTGLKLFELWRYRELVYFMIWRDVKVRYKQTVLGATWAILQPFITMVVFTVLFGRIAKLPTDGIPYPIFSYVALLPWGLFTKALSDAGRSMLANRSMITKVYFPRLVIPLSSVLAGLVDFILAFIVLIGMMIYYHFNTAANYEVTLSWTLLTLPLFLLLAIITSLGVGLWLSALNVNYRDVNYIIPFLSQLWLFITPVAYSAKVIPEKLQLFYSLNPMTGVVEGFRWALLGTGSAPGLQVAISSVISLLVLVSGLIYFRQVERTFADVI